MASAFLFFCKQVFVLFFFFFINSVSGWDGLSWYKKFFRPNKQTDKKKDKKNAFDDDNDNINGVSGWGGLSW